MEACLRIFSGARLPYRVDLGEASVCRLFQHAACLNIPGVKSGFYGLFRGNAAGSLRQLSVGGGET
jgi:hypothetical protein